MLGFSCRCEQPPAEQQPAADAPPPAAAAAAGAPAEVALRVCRDGRVLSVDVALSREDGTGTAHVVHWCGAQIQVRDSPALHAMPCM
jgi:hypothetical protein